MKRKIEKKILDTIRDNLVKTLHPESIYLFGSYAWGNPNESSDIDLFVVVKKSDLSPTRRSVLARESLRDIRHPMDIIVRTKKEFNFIRTVYASLEAKIYEKGKKIYSVR